MSNVIEQLTPNPVNHEHGENGCCKSQMAWEMEMMHQVWAAGLHGAANCFQDALEAKWKLESQRKVKPKTNSDRIRAMTDEELADILYSMCVCSSCGNCPIAQFCGDIFRIVDDWLDWLKAPVEESDE